jgi:hypothetical protein
VREGERKGGKEEIKYSRSAQVAWMASLHPEDAAVIKLLLSSEMENILSTKPGPLGC